MKCSKCDRELHPTDQRQPGFNGEVLCPRCIEQIEKPPIWDRIDDPEIEIRRGAR